MALQVGAAEGLVVIEVRATVLYLRVVVGTSSWGSQCALTSS